MNRLKLLAAIALLGLPLAACEEPVVPPPVGSIMGQVSIEGQGIDGVSVTLSNGAATSTAGGGNYRFDNVEGGSYTVSISGFPADASFDQTSASASIGTSGETATVNFSGSYIRTASVLGTVTVENKGLPGVTVRLTGMGNATMATDNSGQYAFTGLRAGTYGVEISGFDSDDVGFSNTSKSATVGVGESQVVSFDGTYLRTAGIMGQVSVEGKGLEGVTVNLSGSEEDASTTTDASGQYAFAKLRAGDYSVGISGYDTDEYDFEVTSMSVSVALGQTANVAFEGVLLRTAGISGQVSVEGTGLEGVTVTLSGAGDGTTATDASGQYAFAGLVAGDYTVAISGQDEEAYVFDVTSTNVTVADDATEIVNFDGTHATTASISGMLFVDEAGKNDEYDEGEDALAAAGVGLLLVGPGISDRQPSATNEDGQFAFMGLRAGPYQLVIASTDAVPVDYAYGGPATGYSFEIGVGEAATRHLPFDITHQTVNFSVTLKHDDATGDAVPGATVTLYADAAGENKVGDGTTGDDGMAAIRIARASTSGNAVYAAVSSDDYDVDGGMQAVMWDPQDKTSEASNDADIVNLNVDVAVSGATITTDFGGGDALAGWAISVTSGDEAVEGAPEALGDDGTAAFTTTVGADDLPATYMIAVADDQANGATGDGGESYSADALEHTHDGLSLAGTMDAGTLEVTYTTQTLRVYVHHERDQVFGYTGNILGGDARTSGSLDVEIGYIDDAGRRRSFTRAQWSPNNGGMTDRGGVVTFRWVPAAANVIVSADEAVAGIMALGPSELGTYRNMEENGVTGGAFGAMGGFSHSVELCPLMNTAPDGQDFGECGSFAFVNIHAVNGQARKNDVVTNRSDDGFTERTDVSAPGTTVDVDPVEGKNLAGGSRSFTAAEDDDRDTDLDDTKEFNFGSMAAGVYAVTVSSGWAASTGRELDLRAATNINVVPTTGVLYGRVTDSDGFAVADVTVNVNGLSANSDEFGRYIVDDFRGQTRRINRVDYVNKIFVETNHEGSNYTRQIIDFAANDPTEVDVSLSGVGAIAVISGTVRASSGNTPVAGVEILVDGAAPLNAATSGRYRGMLVTGSDGTYEAAIAAKPVGEAAVVTAQKAGMSFTPDEHPVSAIAGSSISGIDFIGFANATISGRVVAPGGGPLSGVTVTATAPDNTVAATATTGATGTYALSVSWGTFTIAASKENYTFEYPNNNQVVSVGPGQGLSYGDIDARTFGASNVKASRDKDETNYPGTISVSWTSDPPSGLTVTHAVETSTDDGVTWTGATFTPDTVAGVATPTDGTIPSASDDAFSVRVVATSNSVAINSAAAGVGAVDPAVSGVEAGRGTDGDSLVVTWAATTNSNSELRVLVTVDASAVGSAVTFVHSAASGDRSWAVQVADTQDWTSTGGAVITVTRADLEAALSVQVQSRQGGDPAEWAGPAASVDAKPSS